MKQISKYTGLILLISFICLLTNACKEEEETFPTFSAPTTWNVNLAEYSVSMTAVVKLPDNLIQYAQPEDQLAAFAGEKCLGKGEISEGLYFVTIHGTTDSEPSIHFQYYSARNKYLYTTDELFTFETDKVFGVVDEPEILPFTIVK
jgi:hypothetical protein